MHLFVVHTVLMDHFAEMWEMLEAGNIVVFKGKINSNEPTFFSQPSLQRLHYPRRSIIRLHRIAIVHESGVASPESELVADVHSKAKMKLDGFWIHSLTFGVNYEGYMFIQLVSGLV